MGAAQNQRGHVLLSGEGQNLFRHIVAAKCFYLGAQPGREFKYPFKALPLCRTGPTVVDGDNSPGCFASFSQPPSGSHQGFSLA